jgi:hypothetical protein
MSHLSSSFGMPTGSIRAGFEAAARTHRSARDGSAFPAERQAAATPVISSRPGTPVEAAIANAARATSVDFNYLLAQAEVESAMNPAARAGTSSATGLYQFIESTWLDTVRKHGDRFGLGAVADEIALTPSGNAHVADPSRRAAILALRNDPQVASLMAAGLAEDNRSHLTPILGRQPSHAEMYLAHFLGAGGAGRFLSEMQADPGQSAPALFARPAAANRAIFYSPDGSPRSLAQVMDVIGGKLDRALDRASASSAGSEAARFARADYGPAADITQTTNAIAGDTMFGPAMPTQASLLSAGLAPPRSSQRPRPAMSDVLGSAFGNDPAATPRQVRRAYDTLRTFGL